jgi:ribosomal protein S4
MPKTFEQKANQSYRRAAIRAQYGKPKDEYRKLRAQRETERAVIAILDGAETN